MARPRAGIPLLCSLALLAGCAVVLDASSDLGPHCRFRGDEDTTCGACISDYCQAEVDDCCGNAQCADRLDLLDDCAESDTLGCLQLYIASADLGECVDEHCQTACDPYASDL